MKYYLLLVFILVSQSGIFAQLEQVTRKQIKDLKKAEGLVEAGSCNKAVKKLSKTISKSDFALARIKRATCFEILGDLDAAITDYEKALELGGTSKQALLFTLGNTCAKNEDYKKAEKYLSQYLASNPTAFRSKKRAQRSLENVRFVLYSKKEYEGVEPISLGESINTNALEYLPSLNAENSRLVFTRRQAGQEDLFISVRKEDGGWEEARPIISINTQENESGQCISADGKTIILTKCDNLTSLGSCDLYISKYVGGTWTKPSNLGLGINTQDWEGQPSLSANGKFLFFSSSRSGSIGGRDIWVSKSLGDDEWSKPVNLGETINSEANEETPFIHPDGQTLYFRSNGRPGYGGYDLYLSRLGSDSWSEPQNLGSPINTAGDEGALFVSFEGSDAYYSSERKKVDAINERGDIDIFRFKMPTEIAPHSVTFVKFIVRNEEGLALPSTVSLHAFDREKSFFTGQTGPEAEILVCLPLGTDYAASIQSEGYFYSSERFELSEIKREIDPLIREFVLYKIPEKKNPEPRVFILENILFETGSAELKHVSFQELEALTNLLRENSLLKASITGHTDDVGSDEDNQKLSELRAESIVDHLIKSGIDAERLSSFGKGETMPIADNTTADGRKKNRRVEITLGIK